tara:strand:- start:1871 stop:2896 length:1026 start_codon:yes stop_codon:yes gene_type:complete
MANIVLGIGCAHTPQLHTPADKWEIRAVRDTQDGVPMWYHGERMTYAEVLEKRKHLNLDAQTAMEIREERLQNSYKAIDKLSGIFAEAKPDVAIVFGNDQGEMFLKDIKPAFTIMGCEQFENMPRTEDQIGRLPPGIALADPGHLPDAETKVFPGHPELAKYLCEAAMDASFDISYSHEQHVADRTRSQLSGMPHAYGFIYKQLFRDHVVPHVPIDNNTFFPPNQPRAPRCFELGKVIGEAVRAWDSSARVAIIASGGLSHFVVDEEFDRDIMAAMERKDFEHLLSYSEGYYQAGSSEIKSWIAMGGAIKDTDLQGHIVDYYALYRTPAGTGSSAAFMYWQ